MDETISGEEICTFDATTATFSITASAELSANDVYLATFQGSSGDNGENIGTLLYDCTVQAAPLTLLIYFYLLIIIHNNNIIFGLKWSSFDCLKKL